MRDDWLRAVLEWAALAAVVITVYIVFPLPA